MSTPTRSEEGSFLVIAMLFLALILAMVLSTMSVVRARVQDIRVSRNQTIAKLAAQSGIHRETADIKQARDLAAIAVACAGIDAMDPNLAEGNGGYTQTYNGQTLLDFGGNPVAEYDVVIDVTGRANPTQRQINVSCYAYVPSRAAYTTGASDAVRADAHATVNTILTASGVFDYSYFINHWGWFFGNNIIANGSVRSNGQFDFGGYGSTINGSPRYLASDGYRLLGYQDDNGDGIKDGSDGGVFSGGKVVNDSAVRGMGALPQNQHEYDGYVKMPNLSDLTYYENQAKSKGATISVGGTTVVSGVLGDDPGEKQHLFLEGTAANPIVLNGPVVVRGSVIISGYVKGQGSIYAGGNVYIPKNLQYVNPPATFRPASNDQATTEAWRQAAIDKDALGLFAREQVVIADYTNSSWQSYVSSWVNNSLNKSAEDAGTDGVQNTRAGRDGIAGTADDDVLEGDGVWTVSRYTAADQAAGRIPAGKSVGDVIPGSGEDIDGDGVYDGTTQMSEFNVPASLNSTNWAGNMPATVPSYSSISTLNINRIDGVLYTNHTLAALMVPGGSTDINMNGAIVSRNESIIYGARNILMNHDERLSGDGSAIFGFNVPVSWDPIQITNWEFGRILPSSVLNDPNAIVHYYVP